MEKVNGRKLSLIFIFILILLVIALLVGKLTYSYLGPTLGEDLSNEGEVTASGDTLIFTKGSNLSLSATTDNFQTGGSNLSSTTNPKVKLVASSKTNSASATYYVGIVINSNSYTYTTSDNTAEVILTIKDENGNNVTSGVDGLTYVTSGGVSGFDVTGKTGLFNIKTDYPISTTSSSTGTTHTWTFTLTFVNLGTDQSENENASMDLDIYLQKTKLMTLVEYVKSQYTGTQGDNGLYYHDSSLANGAGDNSYRYAGGDYVLTEKATTAGMKSLTSSSDTETDGITNFYCDGERQYLYDYGCDTTSQTYYFTLQYDTSNTQYKTYNEALEKAVSDGYLTKDNVKNFVCFGSGVSPCPTENLYRIIGVFDNKVKLMKYTYNTKEQLGEDGDFSETNTLADYGVETTYRGNSTTIDLYYWNYKATGSSTNTWSTSLLNKTNLNTNFINNIGSTWANKIAITTWKVGGNTWANIGTKTSSVAYTNEITNPVTTNTTDNATTYSAKIGLMYVSDYGFAASPSAWSTTLNNYDGYDDNNVAIKDTNWMFIGSDDWTISRSADRSDYAFYVGYVGSVNDYGRVYDYYGVRASFSLESSVSYVSGSGSMSDPIVIN